MKVLIVKLSAFGDIIHCLPALNDLLARPEVSELHWLVDERYRFATEIFPSQVIVHSVPLKGTQPFRSALQAISRLRKIGFDAVFDLQGLIKSALFARACSSSVYGFDRHFVREKASSIFIRNTPFHADEKHVVQQYRRIAAAPFAEKSAGAKTYSPPCIDLDQTSLTSQPEFLARLGLTKKPYIVLHPAAGWETKQLPENEWVTIAQELERSEIQAVLSWGNASEQQQADRVARSSHAMALPNRLNMSELCTLLASAHAVVAADTGLLHLAAALATPTVSFWGPSASWRSAPLEGLQGETNWHIESNPACGPCFKRRCNNFICMDAITAKSIIKILHEL